MTATPLTLQSVRAQWRWLNTGGVISAADYAYESRRPSMVMKEGVVAKMTIHVSSPAPLSQV